MQVKQIDSIDRISQDTWNELLVDDYPFIRHEFLSCLEKTGCVGGQSGWQVNHLVVEEHDRIVAVMPMYLKSHSQGEYVFDHQWAFAYEQQRQHYYPKLLTAIPFTPCQGARILSSSSVNSLDVTRLLIDFIANDIEAKSISSWHCLFPRGEQLNHLQQLKLSIREGVQFQWFNKNYRDFADFIGTFNAGKRKMVNRERRKISELGIEFIQLRGHDVSENQCRTFFDFYQMTYLKKGMPPYLNLNFFLACAETMGEHLLMIFAVKDKAYIGAALSFIGAETLYGRYWGCLQDYNFLHFEACYYQGLDYCLKHGLQRFDSGAQGEHKIARGFEPITTYSAHLFKDKDFKNAVDHFLTREKRSLALYREDAAGYLPFKNNLN
jgi:predicted N-acyltransferase